LFSRIEDIDIEKQIQRLESAKEENKNKEVEEKEEVVENLAEIGFEDFVKVELKIGTILSAEKMKKSKKLLLLSVDLGEDTPRTILSGIAESYSAEEVVGKQVSVVTNLAPRKMMGYESQGMILLAEKNGQLVFVSPEKEIDNGSVIR
ncbi:MAG: methionine--tRNA ligase subunit beta, partial [Cyclobacteriaceae bacterium]|nr:methionine--tRNA ligase subunit beta [Cyclobacteriaceae bacterium]